MSTLLRWMVGQRSQPQPPDGGKFGSREGCAEGMVEVIAVYFRGMEATGCIGEDVAAPVVEGA
jgi:hypothetical protein